MIFVFVSVATNWSSTDMPFVLCVYVTVNANFISLYTAKLAFHSA